jgi:hypothetical protein
MVFPIASLACLSIGIRNVKPQKALLLITNKVLIKPRQRLSQSLLLRKHSRAHRRVASHSETVLDTREQVDLVGLLGALENLLGLVTVLGGEDAVDLGGSNGQRAGDAGELLVGDERRVCCESDVDAVLVVADEVLLPPKILAVLLHKQALIT